MGEWERRCCWAVITVAGVAWFNAGCGESTCIPGSKETGPGVCHVADKTGAAGGGVTTRVDGDGDGQIAEYPGTPRAGSGGTAATSATAGMGGSSQPTVSHSEGGKGGHTSVGIADAGAPPEPHAGSGGDGHEPVDAGAPVDAGGIQVPVAGSNAPPPPPPVLDSGTPDTNIPPPPPPPAPRCGDGNVDQGETCDGNCETSCDDGDPCTTDELSGDSAHCNVACKHTAIVAAKGGDGCCPSKANANTDSDCSASCGNGIVEGVEVCDGECPTACDDGNPCTTDTLVGSAAQCSAKCTFKVVTAAKSGDGCCPSGANANSDDDCAASCGNGVKESGEACDGDCPTSCPANSGCAKYALTGSASTCNSSCSMTTITDRVNDDGCCSSGADFNSDNDCSAPSGCTRQSDGNVLKNAGFATSLDGWKVDGGSGTVAWSSGDYASCSVSGSAQLSADHVIGQYVSQCVPISGGKYYFSAKIKGGGDGGQTTCAVVAYQLSGCTGSGKAEAQLDWVNVAWGPTGSTSFDVDSSLTSAWVGCFLDAHNVTAASEVDQLYLGRSDAEF
jgi:hypothetical protein